jgi:hypothetical protein
MMIRRQPLLLRRVDTDRYDVVGASLRSILGVTAKFFNTYSYAKEGRIDEEKRKEEAQTEGCV